jgi:uncharacterized protein YbjQ (UPF0145 family)
MAFTSDLSIDELLLVEELGFEPLELVMGSSFFHIGWTYSAWSLNQELVEISRMMLLARQTAMGRLTQHAAALGADGVVAMRIEMHRNGHNAEFTAAGTAVRARDGNGVKWRAAHGVPFTCDLSGEDFWALVRGGFRPLALVHGVCVYHVAHQSLGQWFKQAGQNMEQVPFTQALYDAREMAMQRMQHDAAQAGGSGLVGVQIREGSHAWESHILEFVAVGTAITPIPDAHHEVHAPPQVVMFTSDGA